MKKGIILFFLLLHLLNYAQINDSITISEVMFYPRETNGEFIELFNISQNLSVNLSKYHIIYSTSKADTIVEFNNGIILPPNSFTVIFENDYTFSEGIYSTLIPDSTLVLQIDNGKFGSSGMANTSDRTIYLMNQLGDTLDIYNYTANNPAGYSDEKIILNEGNNIENWDNSEELHGTPGYKNSVSPRNFDLNISALNIIPEEIYAEKENEFILQIKNGGIKDASNFKIKMFLDLNRDSIAQSNEIILDEVKSLLLSNDSLEIIANKKFSENGLFNLFAEIEFSHDENLGNNYFSFQILIRPKPNAYNDIVINEIMYKPSGDQPEWIELFNRSGSRINLNDWRITDRTSKPLIADSTYFIEGKGYMVIAEDETIVGFYEITATVKVINLPSLNNTDDDLKLLDSLNSIIDSISYSTNWGGNSGYSLERISTELQSNDSTNWKSSVSNNFATPGKINSITPRRNDLSISNLSVNKAYGIEGESININFKVENIGLTEINNFSIKIYHDINFDSISQATELSKSLNGEHLTVGDSLIYSETLNDFFEGNNNYIIKLVAETDDNIENNQMSISFVGVVLNEIRGDIVINEIMHSPKSPEPEWIEIYNRSSKIINLKKYHVADFTDTTNVLSKDVLLNPNEFYVFADDSSFIESYPDIQKFVVGKIPNLNNSNDRIMILDSLNRIIDSLHYYSLWGGTDGKSLERYDVQQPSADSVNWGSTNLAIGGTPGNINSISVKNIDVESTEIIFTPEKPKYGDQVFVAVKIKNIGKNNFNYKVDLYEYTQCDSANIILLETSNITELNPSDSIISQFNWSIENITGENCFIVKAIVEGDQDNSNNLVKKSISPGFKKASLVVNEIMFSPINGEPEWVELFNTTENLINIEGFTIADIYTTPKITELLGWKYINPNEYLVLAKDSTIFDYHWSIPSQVVITNFANLNNDLDGIVIKDSFGNLIDSMEYNYNWGGTNGFSLEKISINKSSIDSTNWESSRDIELSTPGRKNSITPFNHDLCVMEIETAPEFPTLDDDVFIEAKIKNAGLNTAESYLVKFEYEMTNTLLTLDENTFAELLVSDSVKIKSQNSFHITDSTKIFVEISYKEDENTLNNKITITVYPGAKRNNILINEFMANPNTNESEWIEIYNNSEKEVNVSNWFVSDLFTTPKFGKVAQEPIIIGINEFLVISNDTSKAISSNSDAVEVKFGILGNLEDGIIIYDFNKKIVDSLKYDKDWDIIKGRSLERVSFAENATTIYNWLPSLSISGASPGISNSVLETSPSAENSIIINEIMFDPQIKNSEFVELYNPTGEDVDIGGWEFIINEDDYFEIAPTFLTLKHEDYFVIASDSSILKNYLQIDNSKLKILNSSSLSLSNSGESIVIIDHWGNVIDSLFYNSKWHNQNIASTKNKSLERISFAIDTNEPTNWSTSVNSLGATPGKVNSIFAQNNKTKKGLSFYPNPFSPDDDGFEDFTIINYSLPFTTAQARVKIFNDHGRLVRTLVNNVAVTSSGSIIFDGLDDKGNSLRIGMYIVFMEAVDLNSGERVSYKDVIVVARKL